MDSMPPQRVWPGSVRPRTAICWSVTHEARLSTRHICGPCANLSLVNLCPRCRPVARSAMTCASSRSAQA
jgi:hypothetical protein